MSGQTEMNPEMDQKKSTEQFLAEAEARLLAKMKYARENLGRVLIYGPPMTRKKRNALEWLKGVYLDETGSAIEDEVFNFYCPMFWVFMWNPDKQEFIKSYLGNVI